MKDNKKTLNELLEERLRDMRHGVAASDWQVTTQIIELRRAALIKKIKAEILL